MGTHQNQGRNDGDAKGIEVDESSIMVAEYHDVFGLSHNFNIVLLIDDSRKGDTSKQIT
jgi:hypothetical protein